MVPAGHTEFGREELDAIAWDFLSSEFTEHRYSIWTMERRVDAYLRHRDLEDLINDGAAYDALIQRVMANLGRALRRGYCSPPQN